MPRYGVGKVFYDYGGGGFYIGGVCRNSRQWWSGHDWNDRPVDDCPFRSRADAERFVQVQARFKGLHYYVYEQGDPFGERPAYRPERVERGQT